MIAGVGVGGRIWIGRVQVISWEEIRVLVSYVSQQWNWGQRGILTPLVGLGENRKLTNCWDCTKFQKINLKFGKILGMQGSKLPKNSGAFTRNYHLRNVENFQNLLSQVQKLFWFKFNLKLNISSLYPFLWHPCNARCLFREQW